MVAKLDRNFGTRMNQSCDLITQSGAFRQSASRAFELATEPGPAREASVAQPRAKPAAADVNAIQRRQDVALDFVGPARLGILNLIASIRIREPNRVGGALHGTVREPLRALTPWVPNRIILRPVLHRV